MLFSKLDKRLDMEGVFIHKGKGTKNKLIIRCEVALASAHELGTEKFVEQKRRSMATHFM